MSEAVRNKRAFRDFLRQNDALLGDLHTALAFREISLDDSEASFCAMVDELFAKARSVIVKPTCGSCSYHVQRLTKDSNLSAAWRAMAAAGDYRSRSFLLEEEAEGLEMAVETVVHHDVMDVRVTGYTEAATDGFWETGHFVPAAVCQAEIERLWVLSRRIHNALQLRNVITHMEVKFRPGHPPAIIEFNPRMAGDLTQELHRLVSGIDYYRIAAAIAQGHQPSRALFGERGAYSAALIAFAAPSSGILHATRPCLSQFRTPADRFGTMVPANAAIASHRTNDDRPAYVLLAGTDVADLQNRANAFLREAVSVAQQE